MIGTETIPAEGNKKALKAIILVGEIVIFSALAFVFLQLVVDTCLGIWVASSRGPSGGYTVGLVMLMIGAALMISAVIASHPRRLVVEDEASTPHPPERIGGTTVSIESPGSREMPSNTQAKVSIEMSTGASSGTGDEPKTRSGE